MFLIDSLGAMLSVMLLGMVLPGFQPLFGMPLSKLYILAGIALVFSIYSFVGYLGVLGWRSIYLKAIAIGNLLYCCVTLALLVAFQSDLTLLGKLYFIGEIWVIGCLAVLEWRVASKVLG